MDNSLKDKVLESVDIVEVVGERVALTRKGKDYVGLCPFHDDRRPSLSVSPKKQIFKCWSCGAGGDAIRFVQLRERLSFREALASLARRAGIELRVSAEDKRAAGKRDELLRACKWAEQHFQRNLKSQGAGRTALEYAHGRGLSDETIERLGIGLAIESWDGLLQAANRVGVSREDLQAAGLVVTSDNGRTYDRFRNRLMFPIRDGVGRTIAFGGRTLGDDPAKYLNSPETPVFSKSRVLYGLDLARSAIEKRSQVIVVEGYTDVALLVQHGVDSVVATLGTALTNAHVKLLKPIADTVFLCFDRDQAGMRAADRAVETALRAGISVRVVQIPEGQDPADCVNSAGAKGFEALLQSAVDALEFKWTLTTAAFSAGEGVRGRRVAIEDFLGFVARVVAAGGIDPLDQGMLVGRLSELLSLPAGTIYELLSKARLTVRAEAAVSTPDTSTSSAYDASIRGLPAGMVGAVEDLFGRVLTDSTRFPEVRAPLGSAAEFCATWTKLYGILWSLGESGDVFTRGDVLARCEDGVLCELVSRASERVDALETGAAESGAALERLVSELEVLRMNDLRSHLQQQSQSNAGREQAFRNLLEVARRQNGVLAAESRWIPTSSSGA